MLVDERKIGEVLEGQNVLHQESDSRPRKLHPVLLEAGLDIETNIAGLRRALLVAGPDGGKHAPGSAAYVAEHGTVLDEILRQLDAVLDQIAIATDAVFDMAVEVVGVVSKREGELGMLIDQELCSLGIIDPCGKLSSLKGKPPRKKLPTALLFAVRPY